MNRIPYFMCICIASCMAPKTFENPKPDTHKIDDGVELKRASFKKSKQAVREIKWNRPFLDIAKWKTFPEYADVEWDSDSVVIQFTDELAGTIWQGKEIPVAPFEAKFEARKLQGSDFFCGFTFPVRSQDECVTLVMGGWGGATLGISSIDGMDAGDIDNPTSQTFLFVPEKWYKVEMTVTKKMIQIKINGDSVINQSIEKTKLGLKSGLIEEFVPMSFSTWQTDGQIRNFRWRKILTLD